MPYPASSFGGYVEIIPRDRIRSSFSTDGANPEHLCNLAAIWALEHDIVSVAPDATISDAVES